MSSPYEEIVEGETLLRFAPSARHEKICAILHAAIAGSLATVSTSRQLTPRSIVQLTSGTLVRPDLALLTAATGKVWLAAEIVSSDDHHTDTVTKKSIYEEINLPRLWMIDPRYDNLEIYHGTPYGLALKGILAGREVLRESLIPQLQLKVSDLFAS